MILFIRVIRGYFLKIFYNFTINNRWQIFFKLQEKLESDK
jgi:hypothetical protein